ncbi:MAG: methyltransferase domain-containing protein [Rubrivivax sp.]
MREESIIELGAWLRTAPGRYLLGWEQERLDQAVVDAFGYHALQLGLPELEGLRANRMPHRWVASDSMRMPEADGPMLPPDHGIAGTQPLKQVLAMQCEFDALPFPNASIDLVVLPHALELARDAHQTLREVERVLVPEGRLLISGFNPASLWGLRQRAGRMCHGMGLGRGSSLYLPRSGEFIGYWRLRDWLRLLGFEVEAGRFGCWRPPLQTEAWLERFAWMDRLGDRWWPVLGSVYFLSAVKRVRGVRLVGLVKADKRQIARAPAVVAQRQRSRTREHDTVRDEHAEMET